MLSSVFNFIIDFFTMIINFAFDLQIPLSNDLSIPFGLFILSFFILGLAIKILSVVINSGK